MTDPELDRMMSRVVLAVKEVRKVETRKAMPIIKAFIAFDLGMTLFAAIIARADMMMPLAMCVVGVAWLFYITIVSTNEGGTTYYRRNALRDAGFSEPEIQAAKLLLRRRRI